jgi:hypothetical protein
MFELSADDWALNVAAEDIGTSVLAALADELKISAVVTVGCTSFGLSMRLPREASARSGPCCTHIAVEKLRKGAGRQLEEHVQC